MEKEGLISILNDLFKPLEFKRKGNFWYLRGEQITKLINLQRSYYSKSYYINYGFIINAIPIDGLMDHIGRRLHSKDRVQSENIRISNLLNLENEIKDELREFELKQSIIKNMIPEIQSVNSESDLLNFIKNHETLVPLRVKDYFKIEY